MEPIHLTTPLAASDVARLRTGDLVRLHGVVYTARDAAHERMARLIAEGSPPPVDFTGQIIYYCGPTPPRPGRPIGAAGPTTASRMDPVAPLLIARGLRGMIGKGARSTAVKEALIRHGCVYFGAVEGTAALLGQRITEAEIIAFADLGPEAIYRLVVEDFPVVVVNDVHGGDLYEEGRARYRRPADRPEISGNPAEAGRSPSEISRESS
ncbi:MAG: fumarate hydratase C-terminal domain-containing protein [Armatimonadetes bacterium]|nr:fumarate hydratase C-terminal domain-containing protein [Armatimonadota bacterium]